MSQRHPLPSPCPCGETSGEIIPKDAHLGLYCVGCHRWVKWVGKAELGLEPRHVQKREPLSPKIRQRVLSRDLGRCLLCGQGSREGALLHVDHILPLKEGLAAGFTQAELDHPANLLTLCEACNLGKGATPLRLRFFAVLLAREVRR